MTAAAERTEADCQHRLFEAQAQRTPEATAVVFEGRSLTYAELDARASRVGHHLRSLGVGPNARVGVCLPRSLDLAVALLAVLKAGGGCVPLDPTYPPERLAFLVGDAGLAVVLTADALAGRLPAAGVRLLRLDTDAEDWAGLPATPPPSEVGPGHVAYVIYTSGSTGQPKGVLLTHRGLVNHHRVAADLYALAPGDRVLQFCSIGFDASIEEIFPTWAAGATVVLRSDDVPILGRAWLDWLAAERISVLNLPTAYWHEWARDLDRLGEVVPEHVRLVVVGGEKALGPAYRTWLRVGGDRRRWVNAYGPTEATCMTTTWERPAGGGPEDEPDGPDPPIGRPLPNTTARVVDERDEPVATGVPGELLVGGVGLARGYLNHPELTAERFVDDPDGEPGARLYRTGDLVRWLANGDLEYVGRMDGQVKIRGFRVELGEVEAALARHPSVAEAVVVARQDPPGDRRLVAYVVAADAAPDHRDLRRFLSERLPDHMVPSSIVTLDVLPLTPNGKVDRAGLPAPGPAAPSADPSRGAPASPAELRVAAIWADVLGRDAASIGVDDSFFEIGGHSLLATQVIAQVREEFGTETALRAIFEAPTVAGLAALVAAERAGDVQGTPLTARPREPGARFPLSLAQEQMWAL
ncbi:MAG TPA: non-ribosomal peptide synthetase, partial [Acidimicrobiales bacterium]|nr:non-ribosomal peptide synthetase [Acidimicrobiales bacterium]